jgi:hypothetical protein
VAAGAAPLPSGAMELTETADETQSESQTGDLYDYYYSWSQPALSFARRRYKSQCGNPGLLAAFASIPSAFKEKENNNVVNAAVDSSVAALRWVARFFSIVGKEESLSPPVARPFKTRAKEYDNNNLLLLIRYVGDPLQPRRRSIWNEINSRKRYSTGERGDWLPRLDGWV